MEKNTSGSETSSYKMRVFYFEVFTLKYFTPSYELFEKEMLHQILEQI